MKQTFLLLLLSFTFFTCQQEDPADNAPNHYNIIPRPANLTPKTGQFKISGTTKIIYAPGNTGLKTSAEYLSIILGGLTGADASMEEGDTGEDAVIFRMDKSLPAEAYTLTVTPYEVTISAGSGAGAFYAAQTLQQLIPLDATGAFSIPCVEISDAPRYAYRGMHLDVGRHYFPTDFIKKFIDLMAIYKFNRFHWHLTEDQGWRLEIKKYPKLQEIAACRDETLIGHYSDQPQKYDGKKYCGYYTQDEAREIVKYAADRFITVIPEIEMPGHAQAAIAAYPELGCTGKQVSTATKWGVFENVFCPNEATFEFLENVLLEVMDIFPSKYIHIGGDECPKTQWEQSRFCQDLIKEKGLEDEHGLQSYFIGRMEKFLNEHGRSIIGWDEILEGGLAPNATVMSWRGTEGGIAAAKQLHDVIMTPTTYCYLDYYQSDSPNEPLAIGGYLPLEKVYSYEPTPAELTTAEATHILGVQGNIWTEYMAEPEKVEYMAFPRAIAIAELAWSPKAGKDYDNFISRLSEHTKRLKKMGVNVANKIYDVKTSVLAGDGNGVRVGLSPNMEGIDLRYTLNGTEPTAESPVFSDAIKIEKSGVFRAVSFDGDQAVGSGAQLVFKWHKAAGKRISLTNEPAPKYNGNGPGSVINGIAGSGGRYGGAEWLGFDGKDFEAVIDLGEATEISSVSTRFFNGKGQWIYPPKSFSVATSNDGDNFAEAAQAELSDGDGKIVDVQVDLGGQKTRYLKVVAKRFGLIPAGAQGAGHDAWLFIDELVVE